MASHTCKDPRRTDGAELEVEFTIESYGSSSSYDDPGDAPEFCIDTAVDFTGANVLDLLTDEEREKLEAEIHWSYDFSPDDDPFWYDHD